VIGYQAMLFWTFAKIYGMREGIVPPDDLFTSARGLMSLESGLIAGVVLLIIGIMLGVHAFGVWETNAFGALYTTETLRYVITSGTTLLLGAQTIYGTFFMSVLDIRSAQPTVRREPPRRPQAPATDVVVPS
jgi:hypothetical protein